jgi:FkbM family methyltransferase
MGSSTISLPFADLTLPEVQLMPITYHNSEFYGASAVAAQYCGFQLPPRAPCGYWMHAWGPKQWLEFDSPILYFGPVDVKGKTDYHWVGRLDEQNLLHRHGYKHAKAIGLPIVYVRPKRIERRPGSLLVMPAHSSEDTTSEWRFEEYADEIARIRSSFSEVWVCVHPSCLEHGYWVESFKKRGFPVVHGALHLDRNALERLYRLFSSFEYMTTNQLGSHVAYAAYLGAKVSIYGSYANLQDANYNSVTEFTPYMRQWEWARSESTTRQYYPELFCHPLEAEERIDWGRYEVGFANKVTPAELRALFRWTLGSRLAHGIGRRISNKASACFHLMLPHRLQQRLERRARMRREPDYLRRCETTAELQRLELIPRYTPASTNLLGERFDLVDSKSFLAQYKAIFDQQIYKFQARTDAPLIIDGGANVGLNVLYFKRLFPKSRVLAFEPDPDVFEVLTKNCAAFQLQDVDLIPKALWIQDTVVRFDRDGADAGRIMMDSDWLQAIEVHACRLRDYLNQPVDLLKLDLEGAEVEVLLDCADALDQVDKIVVEYHSYKDQPQKLHLVTQVLHDAGFRLHLQGGLVSSQPLWWQQVIKGMDMRLYFFGFRPRSV